MDDEETVLRNLMDRSRATAERAADAAMLGALPGASYRVWKALCAIFHQPHEDADLRIAAARSLSQRNRAAAPNQLCRALEGDPQRRVRAAAVAQLIALGGPSGAQEAMLQRDLQLQHARMALTPLAHLAMSYGRDPRVLHILQHALGYADPQIRVVAQQGLGMLGEMTAVTQALRDPAPEVRMGAAQTLGYYGLRTPAELAALDAALHDTDERVQREAKVALRRLGALPIPTPRSPAQRTPKRQLATASTATDAAMIGAWRELLERWSQQWLQRASYAVELPDAVIESGWLGYPGATDEELHQLESRLGKALPPSYRAFLRCTNGWRRTTQFIEQLWPTTDIAYFHVRNQRWIEALTSAPGDISAERHRRYGADQNEGIFHAAYLPETIEVSAVGDAAVYLLNPAVVTPESEWEAWFLASWLPGARRYPSFWELLHAEYARFIALERPADEAQQA